MKLTEILSESQRINEKPMGLLKKAGLGIASKFSDKAAGKLQVGNKINAVKTDFEKYLGRSNQQPTVDVLLKYLETKGYPIDRARQIANTSDKNQNDVQNAPSSNIPADIDVPTAQRRAKQKIESIQEQALSNNIIDQIITAAVQDSYKLAGSGIPNIPLSVNAKTKNQSQQQSQQLSLSQVMSYIDNLDKSRKQEIIDYINKSLSTSW
jgi:hypothetical protein